MATAAVLGHDDATTVHVEWNAGGAQTPAGVPDDYGAGLSRRLFDLCECGRELEHDPASRPGFPHWCCKRCGGKNKSHTADCDERHRSNQELQRQRTARDRARTAATVFGELQDMVGGGAIMEFNTKIRPAAPEPSEPRERAAAGVVDPALDEKGRKHLLS